MSAAAEYTRASANVTALEEMRAALCKVDSALDEMTAHPDDDAIVRMARAAVGWSALDKVDDLLRNETARRDAAEVAMREQAKRDVDETRDAA